jgi:tyrosyl-tRNA synthetase
MKLAFEITDSFYGKDGAMRAEADFINKFQKNAAPDEMGSFMFRAYKKCLDVLIESGLVKSKSEGRSMISQKAVKLDGKVIPDWDSTLVPGVLQVGKRKFLRLKD